MVAYCNSSDLYSYGLPRGGLSNPARLVDSVTTASNILTLDQHGFSTDDPVRFRVESGGAMPDPLAEGTEYFAVYVNDNDFSVAATSGGSAIALTTTGEDVLVVAEIPFAETIAWASEMINDMLPAHIVPIEAPYPEIVVMTCAELAAGKLMARQGNSPSDLSRTVADAQKRLERWGKGVPIRGENAPTRHNLSVSAGRAYNDSTGWRTNESI